MSWPVNPTNGQQTTINGIVYEYNNIDAVWNRVFATVNIPDLTTIPTVSYPAQPNITSTGTLSSLTVTGDTVMTGNLTVTGTTEYLNTITLKIQDPVIELGGGANGAPLTTNDNRDRGTVLHYYSPSQSRAVDAFMGWDNSAGEFAFGSNVSMSGEVATFNTYGNVHAGYFLGNGSQLTGVVASSGTATTAATVTANAQPNITSVGTLVNTTMGSANSLSGGNLVSATYLTGTLTTSAQPNITSVGAMSLLDVSTINVDYLRPKTGSTIDVSGYAYLANVNGISFTANSNLSLSGSLSRVYGANLVSATYLTGTLTTNAQPNITSIGTLVNTTMGSGNSLSGGNLVSATYLTGTLTTAIQPNITSVGTLASLTVTGLTTAIGGVKTANIVDTSGTITIQTGYNTNAGDIGVTGNVIAGTGGTGNVIATNLTGTLSTASQTNITSVGTLANLNVSGNTVLSSWLTSGQSTEIVTALGAVSSSTVVCDLSTGASFYHSSVTLGSNWTINFTNVPTTDNRSIVSTIIVVQGSTAYAPTAVQINGTGQTIKWTSGATPTGTPSGVDVLSFALIRSGGAWVQVLGTYSSFL